MTTHGKKRKYPKKKSRITLIEQNVMQQNTL